MARGIYLVFQQGKKITERRDLATLWSPGYRIQKEPAWRLSRGRSHGRVKFKHRRLYFQRRETTYFGTRDAVLIWNPITGYRAMHNRRWYLSFIVSLWVACLFQPKRVAHELRKMGVNGNPYFIGDIVATEIRTWWPEVKKYVEDKYNLKPLIKEQIEKVQGYQDFCYNEKVREIYAKNPVKAAPLISVAANIANRLIETAMQVDKKAEADEKQKEFMEEFRDIFADKAGEKLDEQP